jgi:small-conductance mechanosensitive channel
MPDMTEQTNAMIGWLSTNGVILAVVVIVLWLTYRWTRPAIHRLLTRVIETQTKALEPDATAEADITKRVATIEDLLVKVLRGGVVAAVVIVILGLFDLWSVLAGLGLVLAAVTLAGQSIVLDYLMGILILVEGQYFKGDYIRVGGVEGTVEEVGLRRTLVRDIRGTQHSISNGDIRASANMTRTYAVAMVNIDGVPDRDLEAAIAVLEAAGRELAADPELKGLFLTTPGYAGTTALTAAGATLRLSGRVLPEARVQVEVEMRRRVAAGMSAAGIELIRPGLGAGGAGGGAPRS